jgi:hypothetical protein
VARLDILVPRSIATPASRLLRILLLPGVDKYGPHCDRQVCGAVADVGDSGGVVGRFAS